MYCTYDKKRLTILFNNEHIIEVIYTTVHFVRNPENPIKVSLRGDCLRVTQGKRKENLDASRGIWLVGIFRGKTGNLDQVKHLGGNVHFVLNRDSSSKLCQVSGLENFPHLRSLNIDHGYVSSLPGIEFCSQLSKIDVRGDSLKDLAFISELPVKNFSMTWSGLEDISNLEGIPVSHLDISNNNVRDISPLTNCPIKRLSLAYNPVRDLSPLAGCPIRRLDISYTKVKSLRGIDTSRLRVLRINHALVASLDWEALTSLNTIIIPDPPRNHVGAIGKWTYDRVVPSDVRILLDFRRNHHSVMRDYMVDYW